MASAFIDIIARTDQFSRELDKLQKQTQSLEKTLTSVAIGASAAFVGFGAAIGIAVKEASALEDISASFEVLAGDIETAQQLVKELSEFTAQTPFQFEQVAAAGKQLLGFGFQTDEIKDRLRELGDVSAAVGTPITDLSLIFGQVAAAGKLTGERLLQLQERSVPIGAAIAKTLGVAESAVADLVSSGEVNFEVFAKAFASLSKAGGVAFQGIEKRSQTLSARLSTLTDNFKLLFADIGQLFLPVIKAATEGVVAFIDVIRRNQAIAAFVATVLGLGAALSAIVATVAIGVLGFIKLKAAFIAFSIATNVSTASLAAFNLVSGGVLIAIGAVVAGLFALADGFGDIPGRVKALANVFAQFATDTGAVILTAVQFWLRQLNRLPFLDLSEEIKTVSETLRGAEEESKALAGELSELALAGNKVEPVIRKTGETLGKLGPEADAARKDLEQLRKDLAKLTEEASKAGLTPIQEIQKNANDRVAVVKKALKEGVIKSEKDAAKEIAKIRVLADKQANNLILKGRQNLADKTLQDIAKINREAVQNSRSRIENIRAEAEAQIKQIEEAAEFNEEVARQSAETIKNIRLRAEKEIAEQQKKNAEDAAKFAAEFANKLANNPLIVFDTAQLKRELDKLEPEVKAQVELRLKSVKLIGALSGVANSILRGAEGARELVASGAGLIANLIPVLKPFAGIIQNFVRELSKGPEFIRRQVQEFSAALPQILKNIPEAANEFTRVIIEELPDILIGIIEAVINSLASGAELLFKTASADFILGIVNSVPRIIDSLIAESGRFLDALTEGAVAFIENLVSRAPELITKLIELVPLVIQRMSNLVPLVIFKMASLVGIVISKLVQQTPRFITSLVKQAPLIGRAILEEVTGVGIIKGLLEGQAEDLKRQIEDIEIERDLAEAQLKELELQTTIAKQQREELRERVQGLDPSTQLGQITDLNNNIARLDDTIIKNGEQLVAVRQQLEELPKQQQQLEKELAEEQGGNFLEKIFGSGTALQAGGQVPAGFDNDRFLARLSSGENVIDRSLSEDLRAFLMAQSQPQGGSAQPIIIQIGSRTIAREVRSELESGRVVNL